MSDNNIPYTELTNKIDNTKDSLRDLIDKCVKKEEQDKQLKHYATRTWTLIMGLILV